MQDRWNIVDPNDKELSFTHQCRLLNLNRSPYYLEPAKESAHNLKLMSLIDQEYTAHPFYGSRRMTVWLCVQGRVVNRKRMYYRKLKL